ncbi:MAG: 30S ribosome-binding factor RbfA [Proteiniphilum sp.]|nr:30S ribosome-binding factor RbfA [Proteiniphilum sp.]
MESNRQQKINRLIQKELSDIFLLETKKMRGVLVSVTNVRVTPDLSLAYAYLSIFPSSQGKELMENINGNVKSIRYELGKRVGKQLRIVPDLQFYIDDSLDYIENIDNLLKK